MVKKLFFLSLTLLFFSLAQAQHVDSKKCKTCGKPLMECPYKGKHPNSQTNRPTQTNPTPEAKYGKLVITSTPSGATVKVDGKYKGDTPLTLEKQAPGNYNVTFSDDGYESATKSVTVTADKTATCHADLNRKKEQQQQRSKSGVWMDNNDIVFNHDGKEYRYKMVYVSGGTYTMGCQGEDCDKSEKPAHRVTVDGFYMGQTEVTQALWKVVMGNNPSDWNGNDLPVGNVSWNDAKEFISKLNSLTGVTFRLPTEEEWEFAARGGNSSRGYKYSGSNNIDRVAWYKDNSDDKTHPVAQKQPNELGLYDMCGNAWEWCNNCARITYSNSLDCSRRMLRGGGYFSSGNACHVSTRYYYEASIDDYFSYGFRLAR